MMTLDKEKLAKAVRRARRYVGDVAEKAAPIYKFMDWKWSRDKAFADRRVPTEKELRDELNDLLDNVLKFTTDGNIKGGGLCASVLTLEDSVEVTIAFIAVEESGDSADSED